MLGFTSTTSSKNCYRSCYRRAVP